MNNQPFSRGPWAGDPWRKTTSFCLALVAVLACCASVAIAKGVYTAEDLLRTKAVSSVRISPDGKWIAFTVLVPRKSDEKPGSFYSNLFLISPTSGEIRPFIIGKERVTSVRWSPDGTKLAFLMRRGKNARTQVWTISARGGEAKQATESVTGVLGYRWHPSGDKIAYTAVTPKTKREQALEEKGYGFIFFEENLKPRNLHLVDLVNGNSEQLTQNITVWDFEFSADGKAIAASVTEKNLIDHRYAFRKIHLLDMASKKLTPLTDNPGKLGNFAFGPDGSRIAYAAALTQRDNAVSQALVVTIKSGEVRNLTEPSFRGHVNWVGWKDNSTVVYRANEGVNTTLSTARLTGNGVKRRVILNTGEVGFVFNPPSYTKDFKHMALVGQSPEHPREVFYWKPGTPPKRLTTSNPWLAERKLGKQEAVQYKARDEVEIEGLLIYPVNYEQGQSYPLTVIVHGGPESNFTNRWITRYSEPGQVLAGRGYAVFYPNYRSSTGYGVEYAATGYNDAAGVEFDDIADGIEYLVGEGIADKDRIGLGGGSYGGFASAWFATYYTKYVKAVCMFVGISDLVSKRGTTDIPYEELFVHSGKKLEEMWEKSLKRSPIHYAHQSRTAVLIFGGTADTRVHPSQSLELFRRLEMNDHPAVRLVRYPGEPHGNRKQPGRTDVVYRVLDWYDWYVKDARPLDGPMPPLDISDRYGLDLPE
ncbi:MAG: prolyl oligopeptidase family serine peptidase [bacterium]